jgi:ankyrin repeat protein
MQIVFILLILLCKTEDFFQSIFNRSLLSFLFKFVSLDSSSSINYQDTAGNTALHYCAIYNRTEAVKILLKANIDVNLRNKEGYTSFELATKFQHIDLTKQIKQLMNGNKVDDIVWIGLFDEDYLSDTVDDTDYPSNHSSNRARPVSMISCNNKVKNNYFKFYIVNLSSSS